MSAKKKNGNTHLRFGNRARCSPRITTKLEDTITSVTCSHCTKLGPVAEGKTDRKSPVTSAGDRNEEE